jgi:hypothetical protein
VTAAVWPLVHPDVASSSIVWSCFFQLVRAHALCRSQSNLILMLLLFSSCRAQAIIYSGLLPALASYCARPKFVTRAPPNAAEIGTNRASAALPRLG